MADDLDPAAVERATWNLRMWLLGLGSLTLAQVDDLAPKMARAALTAARAGEPAAPTVSAEQVLEVQYAHIGDDDEHLGPCVLVSDLPLLGIEVTP